MQTSVRETLTSLEVQVPFRTDFLTKSLRDAPAHLQPDTKSNQLRTILSLREIDCAAMALDVRPAAR